MSRPAMRVRIVSAPSKVWMDPARSLIFRRAHPHGEGPNGLVRRHMRRPAFPTGQFVAWTGAWTGVTCWPGLSLPPAWGDDSGRAPDGVRPAGGPDGEPEVRSFANGRRTLRAPGRSALRPG